MDLLAYHWKKLKGDGTEASWMKKCGCASVLYNDRLAKSVTGILLQFVKEIFSVLDGHALPFSLRCAPP